MRPLDLLPWTLSPTLLFSLALAASLYARGRRVLAQRGVPPHRAAGRQLYFWTGLAAAAVALLSPLDALSLELFSAHMTQHMLLALVAAPLLALSAPLGPMLLALPPAWRSRLGRGWQQAPRLRAAWGALSHPLTGWVLTTLTFWVWHLPALYQAALVVPGLHALEHLAFLGTGLLFWWAVARPRRQQSLARGPGAALLIFGQALQSSLLGALITFAAWPWYPAYAASTAAWGLSPLEDQQLAGAIMWVPAGFVYMIAALAVLAAWFRAFEARHPAETAMPLAGPRQDGLT